MQTTCSGSACGCNVSPCKFHYRIEMSYELSLHEMFRAVAILLLFIFVKYFWMRLAWLSNVCDHTKVQYHVITLPPHADTFNDRNLLIGKKFWCFLIINDTELTWNLKKIHRLFSLILLSVFVLHILYTYSQLLRYFRKIYAEIFELYTDVPSRQNQMFAIWLICFKSKYKLVQAEVSNVYILAYPINPIFVESSKLITVLTERLPSVLLSRSIPIWTLISSDAFFTNIFHWSTPCIWHFGRNKGWT